MPQPAEALQSLQPIRRQRAGLRPRRVRSYRRAGLRRNPRRRIQRTRKNAGSAAADSKRTDRTEAADGSAGEKKTEDASSSGESAGGSKESKASTAESTPSVKEESKSSLDPDGSYTSKEDVALYLHLYGKLPSNFITKKEAKALGWQGGSLEPYAPGKCIGGDRFGNYEGILPKVKGRTYYECDIDTLGKKKRGAKRIIYSSDGQIYYTGDHYETFELLYGEE